MKTMRAFLGEMLVSVNIFPVPGLPFRRKPNIALILENIPEVRCPRPADYQGYSGLVCALSQHIRKSGSIPWQGPME